MGMQTVEFWIEMLCRRWVVAAQVGLAAFGIVALGSLLLPAVYQSTAKVLVQFNPTASSCLFRQDCELRSWRAAA